MLVVTFAAHDEWVHPRFNNTRCVLKMRRFWRSRYQGAVACSRFISQVIAASRLVEHISKDGCRLAQTAGRKSEPKMLQRLSSDNWIHLTFAGLPSGMPGMGLLIEGAVQQAPQSGRQCIVILFLYWPATLPADGNKRNPSSSHYSTYMANSTCLKPRARVTCRDILINPGPPGRPDRIAPWQERMKSNAVWL